MSNSIALVPKVKDYPNREAKAQEILDWLISRDIVEAEASPCLLAGDEGYAVAKGAKEIVNVPEGLPFELWTNGLEIITESQVFDPGAFYDEELDTELAESNLGFIFWNWPEFKNEFIQEFSEKLGYEIEIVVARV